MTTHVPLSEQLAHYPRQFAAIDDETQTLVAVAETLDQLTSVIARDGLTGCTVWRVPPSDAVPWA